MSMVGDGMTGDTGPSLTPPPDVPSGGGTVAPGQPLPERRVRGVAGATLAPTAGEMTELPQGAGLAPAQSTQGPMLNEFGYTGQNLVDANGVIVRGQYSIGGDNDEATQILSAMNSAQRASFLNSLYNAGVYGRSKPSVQGFSSRDISATRQALMYANAKGVTIDVAQTLMAAEYGNMGAMSGGGGSRVRTTPKQDLAEVYKQVSLNTLGRIPSQAEINKFVASYQAQQTTEAYGGAQAPSAQVVAQSQVQASNPEEATAMGALSLANVFDNVVKGLA